MFFFDFSAIFLDRARNCLYEWDLIFIEPESTYTFMTTTNDVLKSLADMKVNERGTIVEIQGGEAFSRRLEAIGMVPGKTILKTSAVSSRGPVTIEIDRACLALGYGMAERVLVRVNGSTR